MFKWKKLGLLFNPTKITDRSWLKEFAQAPSVVIKEDFVRVYFSCRPPRDSEGQYVSYSAFVDLDRNNLFKILKVSENPILTLGEKGCFDEFGTYPVSVLSDNGIEIAFYGGWTRCESVPFDVAIGKAISNDGGRSFKKIGPGPIIGPSLHEPFVLSGPKIRKFDAFYYLWYIAGRRWLPTESIAEPVYKIRMASSKDFVKWNRHNKDLIQDKLGPHEAQASPDVFYFENEYHMFFCYRHGLDYRNKERGYRIGYARSSDLLNWKREDEMSGIDVSAEGWDSEMISYPHVFELDGKIYMMYLGNQVGRYGFGLAVLEEFNGKVIK